MERALIGADCSGGCWEVKEVGGGRGRETERREKIHVMVKSCSERNEIKCAVSLKHELSRESSHDKILYGCD